MKRLISLLFVAMAMLVSSPASAQGIDAKKEKIVDTKFVIVTTSLVAATIFDAETTFAALKHPGVREGNSLMGPVVNAGRPATYAVLGAVDTGILYLSYRLKQSPNQSLRKLWWVVPLVTTGGHALAGGFNLRLAFSFR